MKSLSLITLVLVMLLLSVGTASAQDGGPGYLHIGSTAETPFVRTDREMIQTIITNYNLPPQDVVINFEDYHFEHFNVLSVEVHDEVGQTYCQSGFPCTVTVVDGVRMYVEVSFRATPPASWYKKYQDGQMPTSNPDITMQQIGDLLRVKYYNPYWLEINYRTWYTYTAPYTIGVNNN